MKRRNEGRWKWWLRRPITVKAILSQRSWAGRLVWGQVPTENGCNDGAISSGGVAEQECLHAVARKIVGAIEGAGNGEQKCVSREAVRERAAATGSKEHLGGNLKEAVARVIGKN
jgi:hypothetical protein